MTENFKTEVSNGPCMHTWFDDTYVCIACGADLSPKEKAPEDKYGEIYVSNGMLGCRETGDFAPLEYVLESLRFMEIIQ